MNLVYKLLISTLLLNSCSEHKPEIKKLKEEGWNKAYIQIDDDKNSVGTDSTGNVFVKDGIIKKICFNSNRCVDDFSTEENYDNGAEVITTFDSLSYTVYIIPDSPENKDTQDDKGEQKWWQ